MLPLLYRWVLERLENLSIFGGWLPMSCGWTIPLARRIGVPTKRNLRSNLMISISGAVKTINFMVTGPKK